MKINVVERRIMWGDLDALGIVFYPRYYEWIDACGHLFFESIGLPIGEMWKDRKIIFGLAGTSCRYFTPGRYHQTLRITTAIERLDEKTVTLKHVIRVSPDGGLAAEGMEERICLDASDPDRFRAVTIPPDLHEVLRAAAGGEGGARRDFPGGRSTGNRR